MRQGENGPVMTDELMKRKIEKEVEGRGREGERRSLKMIQEIRVYWALAICSRRPNYPLLRFY